MNNNIPKLVYMPKKNKTKISLNHNLFGGVQSPRLYYPYDGLERVGKYFNAQPHLVLDVLSQKGKLVNLYTPNVKSRIINRR